MLVRLKLQVAVGCLQFRCLRHKALKVGLLLHIAGRHADVASIVIAGIVAAGTVVAGIGTVVAGIVIAGIVIAGIVITRK